MKKKAEEQRESNQSGKAAKVVEEIKEPVKEVVKSSSTPSNDKEIKRIEKEISELESKIEEMNLILAELDYTDESKSQAVLSAYEDLKSLLDNKMKAWESLID